ncbi:MAG: Rrf2 family transcriptional regulator [Bacteroidetes bacterium]|nr:Rrf2 family transcriptional regulator [Bacteroidota bacterium]
MKIPKKTTYGMCFMLRLAVSYGDKYIKLNEIAKSENIPEKYLENIVSVFKPANLILVKRGAKGGYKLSMPPGQIKLKEVYEILNGGILQETLVERSLNETLNKKVVIDLWQELRLKLSEFFESITLQDMVNDYKKKHEDQLFYVL